MSQKDIRIATLLRDQGLSVTRQRLLVYEVLEGREPMTMHELYESTKDKLDRASLYRTVAVFEKLGIVKRVYIGWKYKIELSDTFAEHHHHLTCLKCHKIIPINEIELESFIGKVADRHNFKPLEHQVEIQGICESCVTSA